MNQNVLLFSTFFKIPKAEKNFFLNEKVFHHATYTARESIGSTGLYYYRSRVYDANSGRFVREDDWFKQTAIIVQMNDLSEEPILEIKYKLSSVSIDGIEKIIDFDYEVTAEEIELINMVGLSFTLNDFQFIESGSQIDLVYDVEYSTELKTYKIDNHELNWYGYVLGNPVMGVDPYGYIDSDGIYLAVGWGIFIGGTIVSAPSGLGPALIWSAGFHVLVLQTYDYFSGDPTYIMDSKSFFL